MRESSDEDDMSGSDAEDEEVFTMYRDTLLTKGIKTQSKTAHQVAKLQANNAPEGVTQNQDLSLPPIDARRQKPRPAKQKKVSLGGPLDGGEGRRSAKPLRDKKGSVQRSTVGSGLGVPRHLMAAHDKGGSRGDSRKNVLRTAAQNFAETAQKYPPVAGLLNIEYKDQYQDIFEKEPHQAGRVIKPGSPMTKKMDRSYGDKLRQQIRASRTQGSDQAAAQHMSPGLKPVRMEQE